MGNAGAGGDISLTASGNIETNGDWQAISTGAGDTRAGGDISLTASGNITTNSVLETYSASFLGAAGAGGDISFVAGGNIETNGNLLSSSFSSSVNARTGGDIYFNAGGNIETNGNLESYSASELGDAGAGGDISLLAKNGFIRGNNTQVITLSATEQGRATGAGGMATLESNAISGLEVITLSSTGQSGDVEIQGFGDSLVVSDLSLTTSAVVEIGIPFIGPTIRLNLRNIGQSGNTFITSAGNLTLQEVVIQSEANGSRPAGNIFVNSLGEITLTNSEISVNTNSMGSAGDIEITAEGGLTLQGRGLTGADASLSAISNADGNAGDIVLNAPSITVEKGAQISTVASAEGTAGTIRLNTETLTLSNGGEILASSSGSGDGGKIIIDAATSVVLGEGVQDFAPIISVETRGSGRAGDITINTPTFTLSETARIIATAAATATNTEGGSITLNASNMNLAGVVGILAETEGRAPAGTLTLRPFDDNFNQGAPQFDPQLTLLLAPDAKISASTSGSGQGGGLQVFAPEAIIIAGPGRLAVETLGAGDAGDIEIRTQQLTLTDGVEISASTFATSALPSFTRSVEFVDPPPTFTFTEIDDAGQLLATALAVSNQQGSPLEGISGSLSEAGDVDLYQKYSTCKFSGDGVIEVNTGSL